MLVIPFDDIKRGTEELLAGATFEYQNDLFIVVDTAHVLLSSTAGANAKDPSFAARLEDGRIFGFESSEHGGEKVTPHKTVVLSEGHYNELTAAALREVMDEAPSFEGGVQW